MKKVLLLAIVTTMFLVMAGAVFGTACWDYPPDTCTGNVSCNLMTEGSDSWCTEKGCWNFEDSAESCVTGGPTINKTCTWFLPPGGFGWCEQLSCMTYDDTNTTTCEENAAGLTCVYDTESNRCDPPADCGEYTNSTNCNGKTGWSGKDCIWDATSNWCNEMYCGMYNGNATGCNDQTNCDWNAPNCVEKECWNFDNPLVCGNTTGCNWKTETSGQCQEAQCWQFDNISLNGLANETACVNNSYGLSCAWSGDGGWCYPGTLEYQTCSEFLSDKECMDTYYCWWNGTFGGEGNCVDPMDMGGAGGGATVISDMKNPGCYAFDCSQQICEQVDGCTWSGGKCNGNEIEGVQCGNITNSTVCREIPILGKCCEWTAGECQETFSNTCRDEMDDPPTGATYCEDYNSYDNEQLCNQIACDPWFMPCEWDNSSETCGFKSDDFFGAGEDAKMIEIDSKSSCEAAGGQWISDNYCEGSIVVSTGRCEPKYDQANNCNKACFACEYKSDGTAHATATAAQTACENSEKGCEFKADSSAPNGLGFCSAKAQLKAGGAGDCESDCGGCNYLSNPQSSCDSSKAGCKWAPAIQVCVEKTETICSEACDRCYDSDTCINYGEGAAGSCRWDDRQNICRSLDSNTEICWNGLDDNGDDMVDCGDPQCVVDPACGGSSNNCFDYGNSTDCTSAEGCGWSEDNRCVDSMELCSDNDGNEEGCRLLNSSCEWELSLNGGECDFNWSLSKTCQSRNDNSSYCEENLNCTWIEDPEKGNRCEYTFLALESNCTRHDGNYSACIAEPVGCVWFFDQMEGGFCDLATTTTCMENDSLRGDPSACDENDLCAWVDGWCNPIGFMSNYNSGDSSSGGNFEGMGCWVYDGQEEECNNQTGCSYMTNPMGGFCNSDKGCFDLAMDKGACESAGCIFGNFSDMYGSWTECYPAAEVCFRNMTLQMNSTACNETSGCIWMQWDQFDPGHCDPVLFMNDTLSDCESAGGIWMDGFCGDTMDIENFGTMEKGEGVPLAQDPFNDGGQGATELYGFGMKDMDSSLGFGAKVESMQNSAICYNQYITEIGSQGFGSDTAKYFVYLDTDGSTSGNCALKHDSNNQGWEFLFKYQAELDGTTVEETLTAYRCNSGSWTVADIGLSAFRAMMCQDLGGPMIAVEKNDLRRFPSLYDESVDTRVAVAVANATENVSSPTDTAGPGWYSPGTIDFEISDAFSYGGDTATYEDIMKNGYVMYEDCWNDVDDDNDDLVDCYDYDCKYEDICDGVGVNAPGYEDTTTPSIVGVKIEQYPDSARVMYDTSKPANGTAFFYGNDSTCGTLNTTVYDVGVTKASVRAYKSWHSADFFEDTLGDPLAPSTKYYYKLKICDDNGKCAQSACSSFKTSSATSCKYCNFVTRIKVPTGWYVSYDLDQDGLDLHTQGQVCGLSAGMKTNYSAGRDADVYLFDNLNMSETNASGVIFLNATLTKSALNSKVRDVETAGAFKAGSQNDVPYAGLPSATRDKIINSLHPEVCLVTFPKPSSGCTELWHCDDNIQTCEKRDDAVLWNMTDDHCTWTVPYCEFSVWAGGDASSSSSSPPGSTPPSGGSGGGGGSAYEDVAAAGGVVQTWSAAGAGETIEAYINSAGLAVDKITMLFGSAAQNIQLNIDPLGERPSRLPEPPISLVYQFVAMTHSNIEGYVDKYTVKFSIPNAWLEENNVHPADIRIFLYDGMWKKYSASSAQGNDEVTYTIRPSMLGTFAIGGDPMESEGAAITGDAVAGEDITGHVVDVASADEGTTEQAVAEAKEESKSSLFIWVGVLAGVIVVISLFSVMMRKKE